MTKTARDAGVAAFDLIVCNGADTARARVFSRERDTWDYDLWRRHPDGRVVMTTYSADSKEPPPFPTREAALQHLDEWGIRHFIEPATITEGWQ